MLSHLEDSDIFHCHRVRRSHAAEPATNTAVGTGFLTYSMHIDAGELGGNSEVTITPNFSFQGIVAR